MRAAPGQVIFDQLVVDQLSVGDGAALVDRLLIWLQGESLADFSGVLHLAAVWQPEVAALPIVMAINPDTPRSDLDFFLLEAGRAWAQVVITTGKILRDEPELSFRLQGPAARALAAWRNKRGLTDPLTVVVLTSGRGLDLSHRAFEPCHRAEMKVVFLTGNDSEAELARRTAAAGGDFEVQAVADPGIRAAVQWAQARGRRRIVVEAGPSSAAGLYQPPVLVDRLSLSRYRSRSLPDAVRGAAFPGSLSPPFERRHLSPADGSSGGWSFERWEKTEAQTSRKFRES